MCGIEDAQYKDEKIHYWDSVYGFDMRSCLFSSRRRPAPECSMLLSQCSSLVRPGSGHCSTARHGTARPCAARRLIYSGCLFDLGRRVCGADP